MPRRACSTRIRTPTATPSSVCGRRPRRWRSARASSTNSSPPRRMRECGRPSSWPPDWTPVPTAWLGPQAQSSTRSTSRRWSNSRPEPWRTWVPSRRPSAVPWASTCATNGQRCCWRAGLTASGRPRGSPKGCSSISRRRLRTSSSTTSRGSAHRVATSPPSSSPTHRRSPTTGHGACPKASAGSGSTRSCPSSSTRASAVLSSSS